MKIIKLVERELTKGEKSTIERYSGYTENAETFVCIGENLVVPVSNESAGDTEKVLTEAKRIINKTLGTMPDFDYYLMQDGHFVVIMAAGPVMISPDKIEQDVLEDEKSVSAMALRYWGECLDMCKNAEPVAIFDTKE